MADEKKELGRIGYNQTAWNEVIEIAMKQLNDYRLKLDGGTGSVETGGLFDVDQVDVASVGELLKYDKQNSKFIPLKYADVFTTTTTTTTTTTCTFDDPFTGTNGSTPANWKILSGSPEIQSNTYEFSTPGTGEKSEAKFKLSGDFDIRLDFDITQEASFNSWVAGFEVYIDSTHYYRCMVGYFSGLVFINEHQPNYANETAARTVTTGRLRIARTGSNVTVYYDAGGGWTQLGTTTAVGSGDCFVRILGESYTGNPNATIRFDNFDIYEGCGSAYPITTTSTTTTTV